MSASDYAAWWGAATGTVSTVLLGARFKWDRGQEERANKAALRAEIRALAVGAKAEVSEARANAANGFRVGDVGEFVTKCNGDSGLRNLVDRAVGTHKNPNVLMLPDRRKLFDTGHEAGSALYRLGSAWRDLASAEEYPSVYTDHQRSVRAAEFLRLVGPASESCRSLIDALVEIEP